MHFIQSDPFLVRFQHAARSPHNIKRYVSHSSHTVVSRHLARPAPAPELDFVTGTCSRSSMGGGAPDKHPPLPRDAPTRKYVHRSRPRMGFSAFASFLRFLKVRDRLHLDGGGEHHARCNRRGHRREARRKGVKDVMASIIVHAGSLMSLEIEYSARNRPAI